VGGRSGEAWTEYDAGGGDVVISNNRMTSGGTTGYTYVYIDTDFEEVKLEANVISTDTDANQFMMFLGATSNPHAERWSFWAGHYAGGYLNITETTGTTGYSRATSYTASVWNSGSNQNNKVQFTRKGDTLVGRLNMDDDNGGSISYTNSSVEDVETKCGVLPTYQLTTPVDSVIIWSTDIPIASDSFDRDDSASIGSTDGNWPYADAGGDGLAWAEANQSGYPRDVEIINNGVQDPDAGYGYTFVTVDT
ncbi:uncharacterized protein METZ01_LOCUS240983, partial [marine metagenome]